MITSLDRNSPTAMYAQLAERLRRRIIAEGISVGGRLSTVRELIREYRVSLPVVRQAMALLQEEGIVRLEHGRGSFVASLPKIAATAADMRLFLSVDRPSSDPFFGPVLDGAEREASAGGHSLGFAQSSPERALALVASRRPAGVILAGLIPPELPRALEAAGIPVACAGALCCPEPPTDVSWVGNDDRDGAYQAVQHLIVLGHRRIGFLGGDADQLVWRLRLRGYRDALRDACLAEDDTLILHIRSGPIDSPIKGMPLLTRDDRPSAVFAACDTLARGLYRAAQVAGISIPNHLSVVGFDDIAGDLSPALSSIHIDPVRLGKTAQVLLEERIAGAAARQVVLPTHLVARASAIPFLP